MEDVQNTTKNALAPTGTVSSSSSAFQLDCGTDGLEENIPFGGTSFAGGIAAAAQTNFKYKDEPRLPHAIRSDRPFVLQIGTSAALRDASVLQLSLAVCSGQQLLALWEISQFRITSHEQNQIVVTIGSDKTCGLPTNWSSAKARAKDAHGLHSSKELTVRMLAKLGLGNEVCELYTDPIGVATCRYLRGVCEGKYPDGVGGVCRKHAVSVG